MAVKRSKTAEKILKQSATLFSEKGYDAISLRDIADACGIKAPSLYNHFKDKQSLYRGVLEYVFAQQSPELLETLQSEKTAEHKLKEFIRLASEQISDDIVFRQLFQRELLSDDDVYLKFLAEEVMGDTCNALHEILLELSPNGDSHFTTTSIVGLILFQFQLNNIRPYMPGCETKHTDKDYLIEQIQTLVLRQIQL